ncbi:MAG: DNA mismatch repair endonuclease MutL, partial [Anaerolineaceae bacterium]|nr:DNA mismatch repair endonuclease MutL [Anaerolineaceae bacterium]
RVEGGVAARVEPSGAARGTLVRVEDLFYNVPARLNFLKTDATERHQIDGLVTRYALAYPRVRIQLVHDGKALLQTSGKGDRREVLASLYGAAVAKEMLEVSLEEDGMAVSGFISPLTLTRSNRRELTFFVNGRWIQDTALVSALLQAYRNLLMVGRFPVVVLFLELEPEMVDVNVHPAKADVRFRQPDRVFHFVQRAVRRGLMVYSPLPQIGQSTWRSGQLPHWDAGTHRTPDPAWEMGAGNHNPTPDTNVAVDVLTLEKERQAPLPSSALPLLRLVGQVGVTYLVAEGPDGLYLIDQHAAHERVLFERYLFRRVESAVSQTLLQPAILELPQAESRLLETYLPTLKLLGFEVEGFGPGAFRVLSAPALLGGRDALEVVRALVEAFEEDESTFEKELESRLVARICKRAAVKGGQNLSIEEQRALLRDLEACQSPRTCPHGRPTMIHLSVDLLERQFGRRGSR